MKERCLIVAGLLLFLVLAGVYIAHGKPASTPRPAPAAPVMKCERNGCQVLGMLV